MHGEGEEEDKECGRRKWQKMVEENAAQLHHPLQGEEEGEEGMPSKQPHPTLALTVVKKVSPSRAPPSSHQAH